MKPLWGLVFALCLQLAASSFRVGMAGGGPCVLGRASFQGSFDQAHGCRGFFTPLKSCVMLGAGKPMRLALRPP